MMKGVIRKICGNRSDTEVGRDYVASDAADSQDFPVRLLVAAAVVVLLMATQTAGSPHCVPESVPPIPRTADFIEVSGPCTSPAWTKAVELAAVFPAGKGVHPPSPAGLHVVLLALPCFLNLRFKET